VEPAIFLLLGYPGTGKYTVAQALAAAITNLGGTAKVIDNHYINNPIFGVIKTDGRTPLPDEVWTLVAQVRRAVLTAIEDHSPADWSFIFTNYIHAEELASDAGVSAYLRRLERFANTRGGELQVVTLTCGVEELCRRIVQADRVTRLKAISAEWLQTEIEHHALASPESANVLTLDITDLPPAAAAQHILAHYRTTR
jgi:hypothetical protein